jgi:GDP-L-fucose synthase
MRVLVTGSGGMVGRTLAADVRAAGHDLILLTRRDGDLTDAAICDELVRRARPDAVVHLAGKVGGIQANINEPVAFLVDNLRLGLNVMCSARAAGVTRFLNVASSCMYPRDLGKPLEIDDLLTAPLEPTNEGYALAKIASWKLADYMVREDANLVYRTIVPCNLYGPDDDFDPVRSHLLAAAIRKVVEAMREHRAEVDIWGDGTARREFMYAADLADFIWTWLPRLDELPQVMNVGVGDDHTVAEYYEAAAEAADYRGRFAFDASKPVGMMRKLLDVRDQTRLGWSPRTSLREGVTATLRGYLAR